MKTVLLAYDRDQDLAALETLLQARNHRVLKTRSGVEALEVARRDAPHVIVSDVLLPKLDGFALCRRVKEDPLLLHVPVLILSFRVEGPKYEAFAAEVGAERFFPRGSTLEDLCAAIDEVSAGSGTMRMPALVPELIEKREQDRRRVGELERQVKELEGVQQRLAVAERVAREFAERANREKAEHAAADAARIRELQARLEELEARERQLTQANADLYGPQLTRDGDRLFAYIGPGAPGRGSARYDVAFDREETGLTQEALAEAAGVTAKYVSEVENGHVNPSFVVLHDLAEKGFNLSLAAFFSYDTTAAEATDELPPLIVVQARQLGRSDEPGDDRGERRDFSRDFRDEREFGGEDAGLASDVIELGQGDETGLIETPESSAHQRTEPEPEVTETAESAPQKREDRGNRRPRGPRKPKGEAASDGEPQEAAE